MIATKSEFQIAREREDAQTVHIFGIRTRADVLAAATKHFSGSPIDVTSAAGRAADALFCSAARHYGAEVCGGCGSLTLAPEVNHHRSAPSVCDGCQAEVDRAVSGLPDWVKDRDLSDLIPALVRAFCKTKAEAR